MCRDDRTLFLFSRTESGGVTHRGRIEREACDVGAAHTAEDFNLEPVPEARTIAATDVCLGTCPSICLDMCGADLLHDYIWPHVGLVELQDG